MEIFLELLCSIVFSLLLSFFISKLLAHNPTADHTQPDSADSSSTNHSIDQTTSKLSDCIIDQTSTTSAIEIEEKPPFSEKVAIELVTDDHDDAERDYKSVREEGTTPSLDFCSDSTEIGVGGVDESLGDCVKVIDDELVDENPDFIQFTENAIELTEGEISVEEEILLDDDCNDDDWEGIERTDLDKQFGKAVAFVQCRSDLELGSDVDMQLYGLHKVATEGHCRELQPMPFKVSARARWHAWQKLGNLNPEAAMEEYIKLVSQNIPGWLGDDSGGDREQSFSVAGTSTNASDLTSLTHNSTLAENERAKTEMTSNTGCS